MAAQRSEQSRNASRSVVLKPTTRADIEAIERKIEESLAALRRIRHEMQDKSVDAVSLQMGNGDHFGGKLRGWAKKLETDAFVKITEMIEAQAAGDRLQQSLHAKKSRKRLRK